MNYFRIDPDVNWSLFADDQPGFCPCATYLADEYAEILRAVKYVFEDIYGKTAVNARSPLSVHYSGTGPVSFREYGLVFLSAKAQSYHQVIYQFAHELFHHMLTESVPTSYRWFEETLAELSSLVVLHKIFAESERFAPKAYQPFLMSTPTYICNIEKGATDPGNESIAVFIRHQLPSLSKNPYQRSDNLAVAVALFQLFINHPELWKAMLRLPFVAENASLRENLEMISAQASNAFEALSEMIHILCD